MRRQSEHFADYAAALRKLEAMGLVYPAFLSRGEVAALTRDPDWPRDPDGAPLYPGADRDLDPDEAARRIAAGAPYALRLRIAEAAALAGPLVVAGGGRRAGRRDRDDCGRPDGVGRLHPRPQGDADQLPPLGRRSTTRRRA